MRTITIFNKNINNSFFQLKKLFRVLRFPVAHLTAYHMTIAYIILAGAAFVSSPAH